MGSMGHSVALNFEDGLTRLIETRPGEPVADAAYRMGINIPLDCRDGACGTCRVFVEAGSFDGGSYINDALTEDEAAEGYALACQMKPRSDLVLRIAASSDACKIRASDTKARIGAVTRLSDTTIGFSLLADAPVGFLAGQYVSIQVPGTDQKRSYSFSSAPGAAEMRFLVRDIPEGLMSRFLRAAPPGTEVSFSGPSGSFYLRDVKRPVLMLAGGAGLAPFLSMLARLAASGVSQPVRMIYGVTNDADLVETEALDAFAQAIPGFSYVTCVADEASGHGRVGYVTRHIEPAHLNGGDVDIYLCGPPPMVDAVRAHLADADTAPAGFYYEKFSPAGAVTAVAA